MKCEICGKGPMDGTTIQRTGEKGPGKDPHWRCEADLPSDHRINTNVAAVIAIIEVMDEENKK